MLLLMEPLHIGTAALNQGLFLVLLCALMFAMSGAALCYRLPCPLCAELLLLML